MSRPTAMPPSPACSVAPIEPTVSARTTLAPPCSRPKGWVFPATGIRATTRSGEASRNSISIRSPKEPLLILLSSSTSSLRPASSISLPIGVSDAGPRLPCVSRLLLIDGHSMAYRAFFALPVENFSTTTGQHTNAVYGFTSMLINVLRDEQPTHVGVAFDVSRQTFRLEEYADYKAGRNKTPTEFSSQLPLIEEVLGALRIPFLKKDGYEADDIIATLATQALAEDMEVLILTGDRDSIQLVSDRSTVLYPMRGVSDLARMTPEAVETKYAVPPGRYPELAALVGEDSDNLPGVPGVGPKTAAKWITTYDGLDNVITHADKITGKAGENLRAHLGDVIRNRRLNALVRDLPLELAPADMARQEWDRQGALELLDAREARGELRPRIVDLLAPAEEPVPDGGFDLVGEALAPGRVAGFLAGLGT